MLFTRKIDSLFIVNARVPRVLCVESFKDLYIGIQRQFFANNFSMVYFSVYDRLDSKDNETGLQLACQPGEGSYIAALLFKLQCTTTSLLYL